MSKYEHSSSKKVGVVETSGIQQAKAWELAMSPAKTLPMNMMMTVSYTHLTLPTIYSV